MGLRSCGRVWTEWGGTKAGWVPVHIAPAPWHVGTAPVLRGVGALSPRPVSLLQACSRCALDLAPLLQVDACV